MSEQSNNRRSFLQRLGGFTIASLPLSAVGVAASHRVAEEPWLQGMNGKHKQFFDVGKIAEGKPLARVGNFMRAYPEAYQLRASDINALFGAHADGLAFVSSDQLWQRLGLGALFDVKDPASHAVATRNPFIDAAHGASAFGVPAEATVSSLMSQGVRFLACNNSINSLAKRLAAKGLGAEAQLRQEITSGLLPGVTVVPAMLIAGNRAQESGFTYALLS